MLRRRLLVIAFAILAVLVACGPPDEPRTPANEAPVADASPPATSDVPSAMPGVVDASSQQARSPGVTDAAVPRRSYDLVSTMTFADALAHPSCSEVAASASYYHEPQATFGQLEGYCTCPLDVPSPTWQCVRTCPQTYAIARGGACDPAHAKPSCDYAEGQCACQPTTGGSGAWKCGAQCPASFSAAKALAEAAAPRDRECQPSAVCAFPEGKCTCGVAPRCSGVAPPPNPPKVWSCEARRTDGCPDDFPAIGAKCAAARDCKYFCGGRAVCEKGVWQNRSLGPPP